MRFARIDANHTAIVKVLRTYGCSARSTAMIGDGFPDIVAGLRDWRGERINLLIEVKDGDAPPSKQKLTDDEDAFHRNWFGQIAIVRSVDEAIALVRAETKR